MNRVDPMIMAGMPRSGTTLLRRLCNGHPQMRVTYEFGNYNYVGDPLPLYVLRTARRLRDINGKWQIFGPAGEFPPTWIAQLRDRAVNHLANLRAVTTHWTRLARHGTGPVTLSALVAVARKTHPEARVVGDKFPRYIFDLDRFVTFPGLLRLVIYRDCRDVTSSYLRRIRTDWKHRHWTQYMDTAEKIARRWVRAVEVMERHADHLFAIRYEDLVGDPRSELRRLAEWLDVEPSGFDVSKVHQTSVGNYKRGLTSAELDDLLGVAGLTLERLKYSPD